MGKFLLILALQTCLDRAGFSPNTIDGTWGRRSQVALATYCAAKGVPLPPSPEAAFEAFFRNEPPACQTVEVTPADVAALVKIPVRPAEKARLAAMGYETLQEMFAERGHLSETALKRLNPSLPWPNPPVGAKVRIPYFPAHDLRRATRANVLRVSLSRREITAFDANGRFLLLLPCSIAAAKDKLPPPGEILVSTMAPKPNYTYTPDFAPKGAKVRKLIFPPGPNNPVGVVWLGLSLPGYGIHCTPKPEQIGRAESHGCFRLANWNARRLYDICDPGVAVVVER